MARIDASGIPEVAPQASAPDDYEHEQASPGAFGGQLAQGIEAIGQGLTQTSKDWGEVQTDGALNSAMTAVNQHLDQFKTLRGAQALDAQQGTNESIDESIKEARDGLKMPMQQYQFDQSMRTFRERYVAGQIASHADQQAKVHIADTNKDALLLAATNGANVAGDDAHFQTYVHDARAAAVKQVVADGNASDGQAVMAAIRRADQMMYKTQAETLEVTDPVRAQQVVEDHKDVLGLEYAQLSARLRTRVNQQKADQEVPSYLGRMAPPGPDSTGGGSPSPYSLGNVKTVAAAGAGTQGFQQPASAVDGVVLAAKNLRDNYQGLTLAQIGAKWAPPSENNTAAWVQKVAAKSGIEPMAVPNLNDPTQLKSLLAGINVAEKSPADQAHFTDGILQQGVDDTLAGKSPKMIKSDIMMDEAQTIAKIQQDHAGDPHLANLITTQVKAEYANIKSVQLATQLQQQDQTNRAYRTVGDFIHANPTAPIEDVLHKFPNFTEEQAEHLREVSIKAKQEALTGGSSDWGPAAADVDRRIRSNGPDRIINQEQLIPYAKQDGGLTFSGYQALSKKLEEFSKPNAQGDRDLEANFKKSAEKMVTLESDIIPGLKRSGGGEQWNRALPVIQKSISDGRAAGMSSQELFDPDNKKSVWTAIKPYLPTEQEKKNAVVLDAVTKDRQAAATPPFNWQKINTEAEALQAWNSRKLQRGQLEALVGRHPEWGIELPGGPQVPVGGAP